MQFKLNDQMNIFVLKPDFVARGLKVNVCEKLQACGFSILVSKFKRLTKREVAYWYQAEFNRDFPLGAVDTNAQPHINYLTSGDCCALLIQHKTLAGEPLFDYSRKVRGIHYLSKKCKPGSLRFDLRDREHDDIKYVIVDNIYLEPIPKNGIHCATNEIEFAKSMSVFFKNTQLQ